MQQSLLEAAPLLPEEELFGDADFEDPADKARVPDEDPNVSG
jgi:hypothetical protein